MNSQSLVAKVWNFAHVLRDQGVSYQAYISQISYLLFLKMDEERVTPDRRSLDAAGRLALGRHQGPGRRGADGDLRQAARQAVEAGRDHRRDLPQGPERNPGPGQAQPPRRPDRQRNLARPAGRREGRDLRRPAGAQRRGREIGRRAIFHPARADRGDGRGRRSRAGPERPRPRLRHGGLPARGLGAHEGQSPRPRQGRLLRR